MVLHLLIGFLNPLKEIYRIKLPGAVKLGEGKPENQNHAVIFTRGEALQAIDMNQVKHYILDNLLQLQCLLGNSNDLLHQLLIG